MQKEPLYLGLLSSTADPSISRSAVAESERASAVNSGSPILPSCLHEEDSGRLGTAMLGVSPGPIKCLSSDAS